MDRIDKVRGQRLDSNLEAKVQQDQQLVDQIKKGGIWDIYKSLASRGISHNDIEKFFTKQHALYVSQIIQPEQWYASHAEVESPANYCADTKYQFPQSHRLASRLDSNDCKDLTDSYERVLERSERSSRSERTANSARDGSGAKRAMVGKAADTQQIGDGEGDTGTADGSQVEEPVVNVIDTMITDTLNELDTLMEDINQTMLDNQVLTETQDRSAEIKRDIQRLIALAKSGNIDVSYVVIALAKFNMSKNGAIIANLGKKVLQLNDQMNRVNDSLEKGGSTLDTATLQIAQGKTRDLSFQQQWVMSGFQKVVQDVTTSLQQANDLIENINRTKRTLIAAINPGRS